MQLPFPNQKSGRNSGALDFRRMGSNCDVGGYVYIGM